MRQGTGNAETPVSAGQVLRRLAELEQNSIQFYEGVVEGAESEGLRKLAAALIQADQLGISIAKILRIQSEQMRIKRRQRAEEKAHQAPIKMLIPMTFLIFPTILIIILGPAVLILKNSPIFKVM